MRNYLFTLSFSFIFLISVDANSQDADTLKPVQSEVSKKWHQTKAFKTLAVPTVLMGIGTSAMLSDDLFYSSGRVQNYLNAEFPDFHTRIDDYTVYVPVVAVLGLNLAGVKGKHSLGESTILYFLSSGVANAISLSLKYSVGNVRPDSSAYNSFPSGHTTNAFVAAEILHQEYKHKSPWYSVAGYSIAAATGTMRMLNNRHWIGDVLAGAGLGMLSTKVTYLVYPWLAEKVTGKRENNNIGFAPVYDGKTAGFVMVFVLR